MTMHMNLSDVRVHDDRRAASEGLIFVTAKHGTAAYMWPQVLSHGGVMYHYYANEPMSLDQAEYHGGLASYYREDVHPKFAEKKNQPQKQEDDEYDAPRIEGVTYMRLCEQEFLTLRPNRLYYFTVDKNCANCLALAKQYEGQ